MCLEVSAAGSSRRLARLTWRRRSSGNSGSRWNGDRLPWPPPDNSWLSTSPPTNRGYVLIMVCVCVSVCLSVSLSLSLSLSLSSLSLSLFTVYVLVFLYICVCVCVHTYIYIYISQTLITRNFYLSKTSITRTKPTVPAELLYEQVINNFIHLNFDLWKYFLVPP